MKQENKFYAIIDKNQLAVASFNNIQEAEYCLVNWLQTGKKYSLVEINSNAPCLWNEYFED